MLFLNLTIKNICFQLFCIIKENKKLIKDFFNNIKQFLKINFGEVHITHKTIEPFSWWGKL